MVRANVEGGWDYWKLKRSGTRDKTENLRMKDFEDGSRWKCSWEVQVIESWEVVNFVGVTCSVLEGEAAWFVASTVAVALHEALNFRLIVTWILGQ